VSLARLLVISALVAGLFALVRRRGARHALERPLGEVPGYGPLLQAPPKAPSSITPEDMPTTVASTRKPDQTVVGAPPESMDPERREQESAITEETKYERLGEEESEERHDAAEGLKNDPFTERLVSDE